jgi:tetratricopeptide (TPR) repeat protein
MPLFLRALLLVAFVLQGCASGPERRTTIAPQPPAPTVITNATFGDAWRRFQAMPLGHADREPLRARLVEHLIAKGAVEDGDDRYLRLIEHFHAVTSLYAPQEIADGLLPAGLEASARALYEAGQPRGDEARVLASLLVLRSLRAKDPEPGRMYDKIKEWSFESRAALSAPLERFQEGLIEVWDEHARLTPTPEVLATLTRLYVERRDELIALFQGGARGLPDSPAMFEGVRDTAISVAAVYLRQGDVTGAVAHVKALGSLVGTEARFTELLESAQEESVDGASSMLELIRIYQEGGVFDVAQALALTGLRQRPYEPAFAVRLARIAAERGDIENALGWYAEAIRLAPDERMVYDEILDVLSGMMEQGLFGANVEETRVVGTRAAQILEQRLERWPNPAPPVKPEELYLALGVAEMNAGHPDEAERRLRQALAANEAVAGHLQLGFLLGRVGRSKEAAASYERALQLIDARETDPDAPRRAEVLESLGDAFRFSGETNKAIDAYTKGLAVWDTSLGRLKGTRMGIAQLRRGVLLGRLHKAQDARSAFEKAMELAPDVRETYATILVHLLVSEPDAAFAHRVFRHAQNQMSLAPEWKVYFALWLQAIAQRSGVAPEHDVSQVLAELSLGDDWSAKLAQFALTKLSYDQLLAAASDVGQRTEAHFYESMRRLGAGDTTGARETLERVMQAQMVSFYEFAMAQELLVLASGEARAAPASAAPGHAAPVPSAAPKATQHHP